MANIVTMLKSRIWITALLIAVVATAAAPTDTTPDAGAYAPTGALVDIGGYKLHIHATGKETQLWSCGSNSPRVVSGSTGGFPICADGNLGFVECHLNSELIFSSL